MLALRERRNAGEAAKAAPTVTTPMRAREATPPRKLTAPVGCWTLVRWSRPAHHLDMQSSDDQEFLTRADAAMRKVQAALDDFDPDELEADFAGGVLRITFADRKVCIMNRQSAAHQIWLAEGATAWHFVFDAATGRWMDTKDRGPLETVLGEVLTRRLGRAVRL